LLENGEDGFIYVGNSVNPVTLEQIFGVSSLARVPDQVSLAPPHLSTFTLWFLNLLQMWIIARIVHYTPFENKKWVCPRPIICEMLFALDKFFNCFNVD
jgi:hypothetical protein